MDAKGIPAWPNLNGEVLPPGTKDFLVQALGVFAERKGLRV